MYTDFIRMIVCLFVHFAHLLSPALALRSSLICTLSQAVCVCIYVTRFTVYFLSKWFAHSLACVLFLALIRQQRKKSFICLVTSNLVYLCICVQNVLRVKSQNKT